MSMEGIQKAFTAFLEYVNHQSGSPLAGMAAFNMMERARQIARPAMLVVGTKDCFAPPVTRQPEYMASVIPNCYLKYVEGAGIIGMYTHADEYARICMDFFGAK
jgi:pimeloyl-ACP methyl ester carboxylesterase